jgi:3-oxoacyl-[acyl-carrier protein] reductase
MKLKDKVAIITGASKGIGKAIAERYAKEGARVMLASRSLEVLEEIANQIKDSGGQASAMEVDVCDHDSIEDLVRRTVSEYSCLDIMVNNAGISSAHASVDLTPDIWDQAVKTDLYGVFYGCQSAARVMMNQAFGGCIINITSMYGISAVPMRAAYCASKAGANMLTRVLSSEWASHGIRVNAIAPGYIRTELVQDIIDRAILDTEAIEKRTPLGRMGEVRDIEGLAVYLAGDEASFVTGSIFTVDGGWTAYGYI